MSSIQEEALTLELANELISLATLHNTEVGMFPDKVFSINPEQYVALYTAGLVKTFVARQGGIAIGYIIYIVMAHPHFVDTILAKEDGLFVHPAHRTSSIGTRLIKYADNVLMTKYNVDAVSQTATVKFDHSAMLKRLGYEKIETTYMRRLK